MQVLILNISIILTSCLPQFYYNNNNCSNVTYVFTVVLPWFSNTRIPWYLNDNNVIMYFSESEV